MTRRFKLHWKDGTTTIVSGEDLASAMNNRGFGHGVLAALDYHEEITDVVVKTAVIWNEFDHLKYCVVDGDWSEFEGVFINEVRDEHEELQEKLLKLAYDKDGHFILPIVSKEEFAQAIRPGAEIVGALPFVECGFIP